MALISVTRLRLRSLRFLPAFASHSWASSRQARRASGFLGGYLAYEGARTFWTLTAWSDEAAMRHYQGTGAHLGVMPRLLDWCDEASVVHWEQAGPDLPDGATALRRMVDEGRLSKVRYPSPGHASRQIAPAGKVPRPGPRLRPADHRS